MSKNKKTDSDSILVKAIRQLLVFCIVCLIILYALTKDSSLLDLIFIGVGVLCLPFLIEIIKGVINARKQRILEEEYRKVMLAKQIAMKARIDKEFATEKAAGKAVASNEFSALQKEKAAQAQKNQRR